MSNKFRIIFYLAFLSNLTFSKVYNHVNLDPETFINNPNLQESNSEQKPGLTLLTKFLVQDDNTIKENGGVYDETGFDGLNKNEDIAPIGSVERLTQRAKSTAALWAEEKEPEANYDVIGTTEDPENLVGWIAFNVLMISRSRSHKMVKICLPMNEIEKISFVIDLWQKCADKVDISKKFHEKLNPNKKRKLTGNDVDFILAKAGINVEALKGNKTLTSGPKPVSDLQYLIQNQKSKLQAQAQEENNLSPMNFLQTSFESNENGPMNSSPKIPVAPTISTPQPIAVKEEVQASTNSQIISPPSINPPVEVENISKEAKGIEPPKMASASQASKTEQLSEKNLPKSTNDDHSAILEMKDEMHHLNSQLSELSSALTKVLLANKKEEPSISLKNENSEIKTEEKVSDDKVKNFENSTTDSKESSNNVKRSKKIMFTPASTKVTIKSSNATLTDSENKKRSLRFEEKKDDDSSFGDSMINSLALNQ